MYNPDIRFTPISIKQGGSDTREKDYTSFVIYCSIEKYAFCYCSNLKTLRMNSVLPAIEDHEFYRFESLFGFMMPEIVGQNIRILLYGGRRQVGVSIK